MVKLQNKMYNLYYHLLYKEREKRKEELKNEIPPEPNGNDPDVVKIVLKLPHGSRVERRFNKHQSLKVIQFTSFCIYNKKKEIIGFWNVDNVSLILWMALFLGVPIFVD